MLEQIKRGLMVSTLAGVMALTACGGDSAPDLLEESIELTEKATVILKGVSSEGDAKAAQGDLTEIAKDLNAIEKQGKAMTKDLTKESAKVMYDEIKSLVKQMSAATDLQAKEVARIAKKSPEAAAIIEKAMSAK